MNNKIKKIICLIAPIFILLSLIIIIFKNTANGYEISIYDVYPIYFWLLLLISMFCGFIIMFTDSLNDKESEWWKLGFFIIIFSNIIILLLPVFRNYLTFGRADVLSHIGYSLDIIKTGHIGPGGTIGENYYPIIHLLMSSINQLTGLKLELIAQTLPILFILFYMISIYLLSKEITKEKKKSILVTAFGSVLLFKTENLMLAPSVQSFFLLPFILLLFYKSYSNKEDSAKYSVLFVLMLILIPFLHPGEGSLYLIPLFLGIYLSFVIYNKFNLNKDYIKLNHNLLNAIMIIFITWAMWFISFSAFGRNAGKVADWVIYQSGDTNIIQVSSLLGQANLSIFQFFNLAVNSYGQQLIYLSLGLLISIIILKQVFYNKNSVDLEKFTFSILFLIFMGLGIFSFVGYSAVDSFRGLRYLIFISTILIGIFSYDFIKNIKLNYKKFGTILIIFVLIISSLIGVFNIYGSPTTKTVNFQVTEMELKGNNWFLDNRNKSLYVDTITPPQIKRFSSAVLGVNGFYIPNQKIHIKQSPDHFNYTNTTSYGNSLVEDKYFVDWKLNRIFYPSIYPEYKNLWRFTQKDFEYLYNDDKSVDSIYSNGEFWVYYIKSNNG